VTVGRVLSPHGIRGEVKVHPLSDFPERFQAGAQVWLKGAPVRIERSRWQGRIVVLKFEGIDDRDAVETIRDAELLIPEAAPLNEENVFYQHDILGMTVRDLEGRELGKVTDIFSIGSNVCVIDGGGTAPPAGTGRRHARDRRGHQVMTVGLRASSLAEPGCQAVHRAKPPPKT
jgi:16S rRNA processing protein RimM